MLERRAWSYRIFMVLTGVGIGLFIFFPLYWMVATSLKPLPELFRSIPTFVPRAPTIANYIKTLFDTDVLLFVRNSLLVSCGASLLGLAIGATAGYSFSKFRYRGRRGLMMTLLTAQMFPFSVILRTLYPAVRAMGLPDSYVGLILAYVTFSLPSSS